MDNQELAIVLGEMQNIRKDIADWRKEQNGRIRSLEIDRGKIKGALVAAQFAAALTSAALTVLLK